MNHKLFRRVEIAHTNAYMVEMPSPDGFRLPFRSVHTADLLNSISSFHCINACFLAYENLRKLRTLRRFGATMFDGDVSYFYHVDTVVDFLDLGVFRHRTARGQTRYPLWEGYESDETCDNTDAYGVIYGPSPYLGDTVIPLFPGSFRRYVLHLYHDWGVYRLPPHLQDIFERVLVKNIHYSHRHVEEVVVVLHLSPQHPRASRRLSKAVEKFMWNELCRYRVRSYWWGRERFAFFGKMRPPSITLVGFHCDKPQFPFGKWPTTKWLTMDEWLVSLGDRRAIEGERGDGR